MDKKYKIAFSQVYLVIDQLEEVNYKKISQKFINFIDENRDVNYNENINLLSNPDKLTQEAKTLISIMYRMYFCSTEEKAIKEEKDRIEISEKYSYENLFNNKRLIENCENSDSEIKSLTKVEKINIFQKILNLIKRKFKIYK